MNVIAADVSCSSSMAELAELTGNVLSEVYERKGLDNVIVFRCAGDCASAHSDPSLQEVSSWEKALRRLEMASAILIFSSERDCLGCVFDLLLISDFRIVRSESKLGFATQNPVAPPRMSLFRLTNQLGQAHARRAALTGKVLGAEEALGLGLIDAISDDVPGLLNQTLAKYAGTSSAELAIRRRLILEAHALEYENALGAYLAASARGRSEAST